MGAGCGEGRCCRRACRLTASDSPGTPEGVPCSDAMALCADTRLAKFTKPPLQRPCSSRSTCAAQQVCVGGGPDGARACSFHEDTGLTAEGPFLQRTHNWTCIRGDSHGTAMQHPSKASGGTFTLTIAPCGAKRSYRYSLSASGGMLPTWQLPGPPGGSCAAPRAGIA